MLGAPAVTTQGRERKRKDKREKGWGCSSKGVCPIGLDRKASEEALPSSAMSRPKRDRARSSSAHYRSFDQDYSRIGGLSGAELGLNHSPLMGHQRHKRGWSPSWLEEPRTWVALEVGSAPARLFGESRFGETSARPRIFGGV